MGYKSLRHAVEDLERNGHLLRIDEEVDPHLEAAEIQRRVFELGGPAVLYTRVKGTRFPMISNLYGTRERTHFLFRDALAGVRALVAAKVNPADIAQGILQNPFTAFGVPKAASHLLPHPVLSAPVLANRTSIGDLPQMVSWPDDGGAFITLPQVYSEDPDAPGLRSSNMGMYRVQLGGNDYVPNKEIGLHYQLHRGLGVHHTHAAARSERLYVNVFVGGPPAHAVAAVMPLPEGLPEIAFAGALNSRGVRTYRPSQKQGPRPHVFADADFCIQGYIEPRETKREGPFGDHLGYYAKAHEFPVLHVESVHHRDNAIWPFTVVGRPPQEDTMFGDLIHELTAPLVPTVLPGVTAVHAVDAAGVHPLLLAIGSERYVPYRPRTQPMELLTQANAILGQGQMSLAKYLFIAAKQDNAGLDIHNIGAFFQHILERFDPLRDLHFQTNTTIDTLDYSGSGLNQGSKLVWAAVGDKRRTLATQVPGSLQLPSNFADPRVALPGVVTVSGPAWKTPDQAQEDLQVFVAAQTPDLLERGVALIVVVDESAFAAQNLSNWLWITFTRSNPAIDIRGVREHQQHKGWGCEGPVVVDARVKQHHAPPLIEDPAITRRVDAIFAGGSLRSLMRRA
jgi:4-hydroxy-3-polyprenylbenzoate decarboxylase